MERYKQLIEIATDLFGGRMEETKELITTDDIRSKVYIIRGQQVMLDKDLAEIYGYEVKKLNQQVKRNIERFPEDFMFRLSNGEIDSVRSQIVTSRKKDFLLDRKADVDIYHTHLQSKEFICLQQFFVENWRNNRVYLLCVLSGRCVTILGRISSLLLEMKWNF